MVLINLKTYFPRYYTEDDFLLVDDYIADSLSEEKRNEKAQEMERYRHKLFYSFIDNDHIDILALKSIPSPSEEIERKELLQTLHDGMNSLTEKQYRRIYMRYFLNMNLTSIAKEEGCSVNTIKESIEGGLQKLRIYLYLHSCI